MTSHYHVPVLLNETIAALKVQSGGRYIDCTVGEGGHAVEIMKHSRPGGQLLGIDADPQAIESTYERLKEFRESVLLVNENFSNLGIICMEHQFYPVDGILFDLGLSSLQLSKAERGFSIQQDSPLDMRFSPHQRLSAADIVNEYEEDDLAMIIWKYGEEPKSRRIARAIVKHRPVRTTSQLAHLVSGAVRGERKRIHPATRTFQALRIAVNEEIDNLRLALDQATDILAVDGRLVVISFHSLEDRAVKDFIKFEAKKCICPPEFPECVCQHEPRLRMVSKKVIKPASREISFNPRSRSARMRVAERIDQN